MISILEEAAEVRKDRAARVDDPAGNFARIAKIWEVVFGHPVTTKQVALAMIGLKLARECYRHWSDNLIDLCGYCDCLAEIEGDYDNGPDERPCGPDYDPVEELYRFRQQCQEERERDADGPVCGDGPQIKGSDAIIGGGVEVGPAGTVSGNGYRTTSAGHRYAYYNAPGNPDSGP